MEKTKMIYETDPYLEPYKEVIDERLEKIQEKFDLIAKDGSLSAGLNNHIFYGLHRTEGGSWIFREWAPNANRIYLIGEFNNWKRSPSYEMHPVGGGTWEIVLPEMFIHHGELFKLFIEWPGGGGERLPSYATR